MSSAEGDIIRVGALLDCSLLYCIEGCRCTSVSSSEVIICDIKNKKAYYNLFLNKTLAKYDHGVKKHLDLNKKARENKNE